jgi:hypothetical protein
MQILAGPILGETQGLFTRKLRLRAPNKTDVSALVWHGQTSCSPCSVGGD